MKKNGSDFPLYKLLLKKTHLLFKKWKTDGSNCEIESVWLII